MDIMTKVRVLWEKVAGITADVSAVDAKATATAATLAGILPRIPKDYSTTEVNTGVKWVDGKDIYCITLTGQFPEITATTNIDLGELAIDKLLSVSLTTKGASNKYLVNPVTVFSNGTVRVYSVAVTNSEEFYSCILYYTKPDPVPAALAQELRLVQGELLRPGEHHPVACRPDRLLPG